MRSRWQIPLTSFGGDLRPASCHELNVSHLQDGGQQLEHVSDLLLGEFHRCQCRLRQQSQRQCDHTPIGPVGASQSSEKPWNHEPWKGQSAPWRWKEQHASGCCFLPWRCGRAACRPDCRPAHTPTDSGSGTTQDPLTAGTCLQQRRRDRMWLRLLLPPLCATPPQHTRASQKMWISWKHWYLIFCPVIYFKHWNCLNWNSKIQCLRFRCMVP